MDQICSMNMLCVTFGMHQNIYAVLASRTDIIIENPKALKKISFFPKIYNSATKSPKTLSKSKKMWAEEKKAIPRRFTKVNIIRQWSSAS